VKQQATSSEQQKQSKAERERDESIQKLQLATKERDELRKETDRFKQQLDQGTKERASLQLEMKNESERLQKATKRADQLSKERDNLKKETSEQQTELKQQRAQLEQTQAQLKQSRGADLSRLAALLNQYSTSVSSSSSSSPSPLSTIKKSDLTELKLLARGGSKAVHRCLYSGSPAVYYCYLTGETSLKNASKIKQEFEQEVAALTKPALLQHPNILKVLAVRFALFFLSLSSQSFLTVSSLLLSCSLRFRPFRMNWVSLSNSAKAPWPANPCSLLCRSSRRSTMR
jgi:DNA repair exonuclease SbcCD ATPase subunit